MTVKGNFHWHNNPIQLLFGLKKIAVLQGLIQKFPISWLSLQAQIAAKVPLAFGLCNFSVFVVSASSALALTCG